MDKKPLIVVLNSTNPSRLSHLRKLYQLRDRYDFFLICDSRSDISWQKQFIPMARKADMIDVEANLLSIISSIDAVGKPAGIFNLSEFAVPLQARLCEHYELPGPSEEAALFGRNKAQMRKLLLSLGMPIPRFVNINGRTLHLADDLCFPVIVKPTMGGGSTMVRRCETKEELAKAILEFEFKALRSYGEVSLPEDEDSFPLVVEEIIGGELLFESQFPYLVGEISVESVHYKGETHILAIHDKPIPSNGPHFEEQIWSTPSRIPQTLIDLASDYVNRIHRRLGAYVLHTEFRTTEDGLIPLEFGVRMGGACIYNTILQSTGNDFIEIQLDLCQGKKPVIKKNMPIPTIAHCLWAESQGTIAKISGEVELARSPLYLEHQLYDDVGAFAKRAPFSPRSSGHVIYQSNSGFDVIEKELGERLAQFRIEVAPDKPQLGGDELQARRQFA